MTPAPPSSSTKGSPPDPVAAFIRARRQKLGMSVTELADLLGVTPSFVSQIESGAKRPTLENARALAKFLVVPQEVFEAWVRMYRPESLADAAHTVRTITGYFEGEEEEVFRAALKPFSEGVRARRGSADPGSWYRRQSLPQESTVRLQMSSPLDSRSVSVPLIAAGCDPGPGPGVDCPVEQSVLFDRAILGGPHGDDLFAFRAAEGTASRVRDLIEPGSLIIVEREPQKLIASRIYAVRLGKELVLSHVSRHGNVLVLLPDERGADVETIELKDDKQLYTDVIRGRVLAVVRSWE